MKETLNNLGVRLSSLIDEYANDVKEGVAIKLEETANKIIEYIKNNCPRDENGSNHLADSFIKTEVGNGINKVIYISSKNKGRLVHLIELGFKHRSGKHVSARPFMRPAYDSFTPEMLEEIKIIIKNGGLI